MNKNEQIAVNRIETLTSSDFQRIVQIASPGYGWHYVGSNSKSSGRDAHWISFKDEDFCSITSSLYSNDEFMLIQETSAGLYELKKIAASVIPFGDCLAGGLDPQKDEDLSKIIWNIIHALPGHGGYTDIISNPKLSEEAENLSMPMGEELINKVFSQAVAGWDVPV